MVGDQLGVIYQGTIGKYFASQSKSFVPQYGAIQREMRRAYRLFTFMKLTLSAEYKIHLEERWSRMTKKSMGVNIFTF